jgi:hypothetical protein
VKLVVADMSGERRTYVAHLGLFIVRVKISKLGYVRGWPFFSFQGSCKRKI